MSLVKYSLVYKNHYNLVGLCSILINLMIKARTEACQVIIVPVSQYNSSYSWFYLKFRFKFQWLGSTLLIWSFTFYVKFCSVFNLCLMLIANTLM